jgi:gluconolactonase
MRRVMLMTAGSVLAGGMAIGAAQAPPSASAVTSLAQGQPAPTAPATAAAAGPSKILAPGAAVEKIATGFIFTEGPTSDTAGNVYFVDQDNNRIHKYDLNGQTSIFLEPSGRANGLMFDGKGHLIAAADEKNEVWSIDIATKAKTVLVGLVADKYLNGPNDVYVHGSGRIYFTDPYFRRNWWTRGDRTASEGPQAVYLYSPADKSVKPLITDLRQPNGILGTPDGKKMYIADYGGRQTFVYDVNADGTLTNKTLFAASGSDGLTLDSLGNVYLTTGRNVAVYDKAGQLLEQIPVPEVPSNVCFGGKDMQTLFITARTSLYAVKTIVKGVGAQ